MSSLENGTKLAFKVAMPPSSPQSTCNCPYGALWQAFDTPVTSLHANSSCCWTTTSEHTRYQPSSIQGILQVCKGLVLVRVFESESLTCSDISSIVTATSWYGHRIQSVREQHCCVSESVLGFTALCELPQSPPREYESAA